MLQALNSSGIILVPAIRTNPQPMHHSYLVITFRNLSRRLLYSGINIFSLSFGLAITGLVLLYARHELGYDHFHHQVDRIYRVSGKRTDTWFASLSKAYSDALYEKKFPEVEKTVRVRGWPPKYILSENKKFYEERVLFTDSRSDFFEIFNFPAVYGNLDNALTQPNSVVLTRSMAAKIFGNKTAIGETLAFDTINLKVTAVIEDLPSNSHMDFKVLISNDEAVAQASGLFTYCVLSEGADPEVLEKKIMTIPAPARASSVLKGSRIIALKDLHFEGNMTFEMKPQGSRLYLFVFILIGLMILVLSCFNFINLSIAVYAQRMKEIAIRKVVGAHRSDIAKQFLMEAMCIALICLPVIVALLEMMLPMFNAFMGIRIVNIFIYTVPGFLVLLGLTLLIGITAGAYPAWILPRINSLILFKNNRMVGSGSLNVRTVLVAFQITMMVVMLSGSWIIRDQLRFLQQKDLGFTREGVLKLKGAWNVDSVQYVSLRSKLLDHPSVASVSQGFVPGDEDYGSSFRAEGATEVYHDLIFFGTDAGYIKTLDLKILTSSFGTSPESLPERAVLINETLARRLGYEDPIGRSVVVSPGLEYERTRVINGVFKDFHFFSLHQSMMPMMLIIRPYAGGINENILVKIRPGNLPETMNYITKAAGEIVSDTPLVPEFLDDSINRLYDREQKLSFFCTILLLITVLLSILGLIGLASYTAELKTKEIGIRKVLGATIPGILKLISLPFFRLALVAFVMGSALSFYLVNKWLESFTYKISLSWYFYAYTFAGLLLILLVTVGGHALKASLANPVKSLRSE